MFTIEQSITIDRPVAEVFAYFADPQNIPCWRPDVLEVRGTNGTIALGATFEELVKFMGRKIFTMQVTDYQPDHRLTIQAIAGPNVRPTQNFQFATTSGGTHVSFRGDIRTGGLFRLMEPLLPSMLSKLWVGYLANLKRILEDRAA
jgi:uncharacterized protein YndB with AHSA1/START domain